MVYGGVFAVCVGGASLCRGTGIERTAVALVFYDRVVGLPPPKQRDFCIFGNGGAAGFVATAGEKAHVRLGGGGACLLSSLAGTDSSCPAGGAAGHHREPDHAGTASALRLCQRRKSEAGGSGDAGSGGAVGADRRGLRNPMLYLEAEIRQTAGYYALHIPHDQILYSEYFMVDNPFGIENERKMFSYDASLAMGEFLQWFQTFYNRVWSLGMNTWLLLFALACTLYRGRRAIAFAPCVMLLGSLLLATPVYNEFRYAYGVFVALPVLFSVGVGREEQYPQS